MKSSSSPYHVLLAISFEESTLILSCAAELKPLNESAFLTSSSTISLSNICDESLCLQVCPFSIRTVRILENSTALLSSKEIADKSSGLSVSSASIRGTFCALQMSDGSVCVLQVMDSGEILAPIPVPTPSPVTALCIYQDSGSVLSKSVTSSHSTPEDRDAHLGQEAVRNVEFDYEHVLYGEHMDGESIPNEDSASVMKQESDEDAYLLFCVTEDSSLLVYNIPHLQTLFFTLGFTIGYSIYRNHLYEMNSSTFKFEEESIVDIAIDTFGNHRLPYIFVSLDYSFS